MRKPSDRKPSDRADSKERRPLVTAGRHRPDQPARLGISLPGTAGTWYVNVGRKLTLFQRRRHGTAQSTARTLAAAGQWQPDRLASLAALRIQAAATTAHWQSGRSTSPFIRQIKADAARCEREGDLARAADIRYGPAAELEPHPLAAAKAPGNLQADPERAAAQSTFTNSLTLLRQARERLAPGTASRRGRQHRRV